jgi:maleate isomerase
MKNAHAVKGLLSNKILNCANSHSHPKPLYTNNGIYYNGNLLENYSHIDTNKYYQDPLHSNKKFGLIIPATNTTMEKEIWTVFIKNNTVKSLQQIGFHTTNVLTPIPNIKTENDILNYKESFLNGLEDAVNMALLADPDYMVMGMSLEHILYGIDNVTSPINKVIELSGLSWTTCHDAIHCALEKYNAKRIGIITPFEKSGNISTKCMFEDLGYDVIADIGLSCANTQHIAHLPDYLKEKAVLELLDTQQNNLDAIVQCGTNMSFLHIAEKLESIIEKPILSINATVLWYTLRENRILDKLNHSSRLFIDH